MKRFIVICAIAFLTMIGFATRPEASGWKLFVNDPPYSSAQAACDAHMPADGLILPLLGIVYHIEYDIFKPQGLMYADCYYHHYLQAGGIRKLSASAFLQCDAGEIPAQGVFAQCIPDQVDFALGKDSCGDANNRNLHVGNPIDVVTGNKFEEVVEYDSGGPDPLQFIRYYNSRDRERYPNIMAYAWRTNFDRRVLTWDTGTGQRRVRIVLADGRHVQFVGSAGTNVWTPIRTDTDYKMVLRTGSLGDIDLTNSNDTVESYTGYWLTKIRYRNGYTINLTPPVANGNMTVSDNRGRTITFALIDWKIDTVTLPGGKVIKYEYDNPLVPGSTYIPRQRLIKAVYPDDDANPSNNPTVTYHYEDSRFPLGLTGITDERGIRVATWAYDAKYRAISSQHAGGADLTTIAYNDVDNSRTVTNPLGKQAIYRTQLVQAMRKVTQIDGQASPNCPAASSLTAHNANGYVNSRTDWNGRVTTYTRDTRGLELTRTEASGTPQARTITTTWHATFRVPTQIVMPGRTASFTYDTSGRLLTRTETDTTTQSVPYSTNGRTRTWTYTWSSTGQMLTADGPRTDVTDLTTFTYNAAGLVATVTNTLGQVTQITSYDPRGYPLTIIDPNNVTSTFTYDARGRLLTRTIQAAAGNATTAFQYSPAGMISRATLPDGSYLDYSYDDAQRLTRSANASGERIDLTLDAMGNVTRTETKDAGLSIVRLQRSAFDELGRTLQDIGAVNQTTIYGYDNNSNPTATTDPLSHPWGRTFDALNRLTRITDPLTGQANYAYDDRDNLVSVTDQRGLATSYVYDGFGYLIQEASPDAGTTVYQTDVAGNRTQKTDARGVVTNYAYDALNRLTSATYPSAAAENVTYAYDQVSGLKGVGRLTTITDQSGSTAYQYDERGNTTRETRAIGGVAYVTDYAYDLADRLVQIIYPSGRIVSYARDSLGRVTGITTKQNALASPATVVSGATYRPFGGVAGFTYGNGLVWTRGFDQDERPTAQSAIEGANTAQDLGYGYDLNSNITSIVDARLPARTQGFQYDSLDRLTRATGLYQQLDYTYDGVGNRLTQTKTGAGAFSETLAYGATNNRLETVTRGTDVRGLAYAASGQATNDDRGPAAVYGFAINARGRVAEAQLLGQPVAQYQYNAMQRRVLKTIPGAPATATAYHYGPGGLLLAESDGSGAAQREYVWLGGMPVGHVEAAGPTLYFVHADHLGTPAALTDATPAIVWDAALTPWGQVETQNGTVQVNLRLPGQYYDAETGLHYNWNRDYDPSTGRYMQSDPIGLAGGVNRYGYVGGKPTKWVDPTGKVAGADDILMGLGIGASILLADPNFRKWCEKRGDELQKWLNNMLSENKQGDGAQSQKPAKGKENTDGEEGCIYCVKGDKTSSGKDYIGSSDNLDQRERDKRDGRDREGAEVVDTYPKGDRDARRNKEQQTINDRGGVDKLDNRRNEVAPKSWPSRGIVGP